jgi:hypothetical protein
MTAFAAEAPIDSSATLSLWFIATLFRPSRAARFDFTGSTILL